MATTKIKIESPDQVFNVLSQTSAGQTYKLTGGKKKNSPSLVLAFTNALRTAQSDGAGTTAFGSITDGVKNKNGDISFSFEGRTVIVGKGLFGFAQRLFTSTPADGRLFEVGTAWTVYAQANPPGPTPGPGPTPTPGQTFTLTTAIQTTPESGTMGANSTVNGFVNAALAGGANTGTLQTGDTINANTTSKVNVQILQDTTTLATVNNAGSVNFRGLSALTALQQAAAVASPQNALLYTGVNNITSTDSLGDVSVTNGPLQTTYSLVNPVVATAAVGGFGVGMSVGVRAQDRTGATDTLALAIAGVGSSTGTRAVPLAAPAPLTVLTNSTGGAGGIETINLATTGTNIVTLNIGTDATRLNISGAGNNTVAFAAGGIANAAVKTISLSGASGTNTLNIAGNVQSGDTYTGGTGTSDTLRATFNGQNLINVNVSGFETLRLASVDQAGALGAVTFATSAGLTNVRVDAVATNVAGTALTVTSLVNPGSFSTVRLVGAGTTATAAATQNFSGVTTFTGAFTGTADTVTVALSNQGTALTAAQAYTAFGALTLNGAERINVTVADAPATSNTTLASVGSNTLQTFAPTSNGTVAVAVLGAVNGLGGTLTTVDFTGVTTSPAAISSITVITEGSLAPFATIAAGVGGLSVNGIGQEAATDNLTFTGNTGVDTLVAQNPLGVGFLGTLNFTGGAGADVLTMSANSFARYAIGTTGSAQTGAVATGVVDRIIGSGVLVPGAFAATNLISGLGVAGVVGEYTEAVGTTGDTYAVALAAANVVFATTPAQSYFLTTFGTDGVGALSTVQSVLFLNMDNNATADGAILIGAAGATASQLAGLGLLAGTNILA